MPDFTEEQADELLGSIENPSEGTQQEATPPPVQEYSFTHSGKEIKAPIDNILKWASQGYDAPNRIGDLSKQIEDYKQKEGQFKQYEERYGAVDKYAKENPQWWDHVSKSYQQLLAESQGSQSPQLTEFQKELEELKNFKLQLEQDRQSEQMKREDETYQNELSALTKAYPKIDFNTVGPDGKSLEYKVLQHAKENGIKKFTTAFRDFYHDELMKMQAEGAKESLLKERQAKQKFGILGESFHSAKQVNNNVKGKSYADLEKEALRELGIE